MDPVVATLIDAWDWSYLDTEAAFEGIAPSNLHRRPSPNVMAFSEHVAHLLRSEASIIARYILGEPEHQWADAPLLRAPYGWPPDVLASPISPALQAYDTEGLLHAYRERHVALARKARMVPLAADHRFQDDWSGPAPTLADRLRFAAYHVAYHTGQMFLVRRLLGEEPPDN